MATTIASINGWGGCCVTDPQTAPNDFVNFAVELAMGHDVMMFQEVPWSYSNNHPRFVNMKDPGHRPGPIDTRLGNLIAERLKATHFVSFAPHFKDFAYHDYEKTSSKVRTGNLLVVKKAITILRLDDPWVYRQGELSNQKKWSKGCSTVNFGQPASRRMQILTVQLGQELLTIANFHGLHSRHGKNVPIPAHIAQSAGVITGFNRHLKRLGDMKSSRLLMGDYNLTPGLPGYEMLRDSTDLWGDKCLDLNVLWSINDTRTALYPKSKSVRVADYTLASADLRDKIISYVATENVPSDHKMLVLTLSL